MKTNGRTPVGNLACVYLIAQQMQLTFKVIKTCEIRFRLSNHQYKDIT
jgi:hypothetical protein